MTGCEPCGVPVPFPPPGLPPRCEWPVGGCTSRDTQFDEGWGGYLCAEHQRQFVADVTAALMGDLAALAPGIYDDDGETH